MTVCLPTFTTTQECCHVRTPRCTAVGARDALPLEEMDLCEGRCSRSHAHPVLGARERLFNGGSMSRGAAEGGHLEFFSGLARTIAHRMFRLAELPLAEGI